MVWHKRQKATWKRQLDNFFLYWLRFTITHLITINHITTNFWLSVYNRRHFTYSKDIHTIPVAWKYGTSSHVEQAEQILHRAVDRKIESEFHFYHSCLRTSVENQKSMQCSLLLDQYNRKWFEPRSTSSSSCVIVRTRVVLIITNVGDWRFSKPGQKSSSIVSTGRSDKANNLINIIY